MKKVLAILIVAATCAAALGLALALHGCAPQSDEWCVPGPETKYPIIIYVEQGCTSRGCNRMVRLTKDANGTREAVEVDPITKEPINQEGSGK